MPVDSKVPEISRTYEVRFLDGRTVTVQSDLRFDDGACVQLRSSADLSRVGSDPSYNHVLGLLSPAKGC